VSLSETRRQVSFHAPFHHFLSTLTLCQSENTQQQLTYTVHGINIKATAEMKYPGNALASGRSWGKHIQNICGIALNKLGFIKWVVEKYSDRRVKKPCYFALVRPHLEYAASIWDPGHRDLIRRLNKIQRKAARFVKNRYERTQSATQLLLELGWEPLETRRLHARLRPLEKFRSDLSQSDGVDIIGPTLHIQMQQKRRHWRDKFPDR
jgi:hypothetical protein